MSMVLTPPTGTSVGKPRPKMTVVTADRRVKHE